MKASTIGGIRKLNYQFKQRRREVLGEQPSIEQAYLIVCEDFLKRMAALQQINREFLRKKYDIDSELFSKMLAKVDQDYFAVIGLGKRMPPCESLGLS